MPTPRASEVKKIAPAAIIVVAATLLVVGFGVSNTRERSLDSEASSWRGLVGGPRPAVTVGQRQIVVLKAPSLAQRVAQNGGFATQRKEDEGARPAGAAPKQPPTPPGGDGGPGRAAFRFSRALHGFSPPPPPRAGARPG